MTEMHEKRVWAQLMTKFDSRGFIHLRPPDEDSSKSFEDSLEYISDVLGATGVGDGDGFSVLQALPSQRRVALSVGRSLSKLKYTTIVRVNKSETLSKIVFVLRCQING